MSGRTRRLAMMATIASALAAGLVGHYAREVWLARRDTPRVVREALAARPIVLPPEALSAPQRSALLAVQDPGFDSHRGWDFRHGTMTTITQALVKWYYFDDFHPGVAKIRQSLIARFALDPGLTKRDQLALFINNVWLAKVGGRDILGFAEGAQRFYGKRFSELSFDEYLSLLVFDSPATLNVHVNPRGNARRVRQIRLLLAGRCRRPGLLRLPPHCWSEEPGAQ